MPEVSPPFIYLASQSPRRAQLLEQIGVGYKLLLPDSHEDPEALEVVLADEDPRSYVVRVTQLKLQAAVQRLSRRIQTSKSTPVDEEDQEVEKNQDLYVNAPVLCADTTVALGREILGKPTSPSDAVQMLERLSGQTHVVLTALSLSWGDSGEGRDIPFVSALSVSRVEFANLTSLQIQNYVDTGEPMGKAGAYGVQGRAAGFIKNIEGSYSGIMGLPLFECSQLLKDVGWVSFK